MKATEVDRGMLAVRRARSVRERDSRVGLQQALQEHQQRRRHLTTLQDRLAEASAWQEGDISSYLARRHGLLALGDAIVRATEQVDAAQQIADSAHAHWSHDKVRLSAVESLLERRAEVRRAERARREAAELDDIAAQLWIRSRGADASPTPDPTLHDREAAR